MKRRRSGRRRWMKMVYDGKIAASKRNENHTKERRQFTRI